MSLRLSTFKRDCTKIDIDLHDIIEIDLNRKIVRLEPCVNMGQITDHLNKLGWTLALTIEMEGKLFHLNVAMQRIANRI